MNASGEAAEGLVRSLVEISLAANAASPLENSLAAREKKKVAAPPPNVSRSRIPPATQAKIAQTAGFAYY